jgi:3-oxoacyl-[acyl-carrier-protein] synthase-3
VNSEATISAIEFELPAAVLDNERLAAEYSDWTAEKILAKTGIRERHIAGPDEYASDLAVRAGQKLLRNNGCRAEEIDYLIYCTQSPDYLLPTSACLIQERLGLPTSCAALEFNLGSSGYIYGLGLAKALIQTGQAHSLLFLTADTYSKFINPKDKSVRTLFGDAATATLIQGGTGGGKLIGPFVYGTDGKGKNNVIVPTRGLRQDFQPSAELVTDPTGSARTVNDLYMNGPEIFTFTIKTVPEMIGQLLAKTGLKLEDIDLFVFHQANLFMMQHLQKKMGIPKERFWVAFEDVGNTVSCTIPIAFKKAIAVDRIAKDSLLLLAGFGAGYSWGATLVRWQSP